MADVILTCPECEKKTAVSEYYSENTAVCHACGHVFHMPERKRPAAIRLKQKEKPIEPAKAPAHVSVNDNAAELPSLGMRRSRILEREKRRVKISRVVMSVSWLVFVVLAVCLAYIRFYNGCQFIPLEKIKNYGIIAVCISYVAIICLALTDNMFDGLLCIVVPLYPFYYLFIVSGNVYMRAVIGAVFVVFGYDFLLVVQTLLAGWYEKINYLIQNA